MSEQSQKGSGQCGWKNERIPVSPLPPYPEESLEEDSMGHQRLVDFYNALGNGELMQVNHARLLRPRELCHYRSEAIALDSESVHQGVDEWRVRPVFISEGTPFLLRFLFGRPLLQCARRDEGELLITSMRILFYGKKEVAAWNISEILNARGSDGIVQIFPNGSGTRFIAAPDSILFLKVLEGVMRIAAIEQP